MTSVVSTQNSAQCRVVPHSEENSCTGHLSFLDIREKFNDRPSPRVLTCRILLTPESIWYCRNSDNCSFDAIPHILSILKSVKQKIRCNRTTLSLIGWPLRIKGFRIHNPAGDRESAYSCNNSWNVQTNRKCFWLHLFYATRLFIRRIWKKKMPT